MLDWIIELIEEVFKETLDPTKTKTHEPAWVRWLPLCLFIAAVGSLFISFHLWDDGYEWILPAVLFTLTAAAVIYRFFKD